MGNQPLLTKAFSGSLRAWAGCRKDYRTKLSLRIASVLLLFMAMLPYTAGAFNNHLTDANYYDAALRGRDKIHFKVPIFQEDRGGADYATGTGNVWYQKNGETERHTIVDFRAGSFISGTVTVMSGFVVITSDRDGTHPSFGEGSHMLWLTNNSGLTTLEFDWYPAEDMHEVTFSVGVQTSVYESYDWNQGDSRYHNITYSLATFSNIGTADVQPQLVDPVFYSSAEGTATACGLLAVPYVSFQQPYLYHTSWNTTRIPCAEQSGMLYVQSEDTVRPGFRIYMLVRSSASTDSTEVRQWTVSNKVNIPAYHRIHDFSVATYRYTRVGDTTHTYCDNRYKTLSWKLRHPGEQDIVQNDMFEIQRAYRSDFSDAQTIELLPIEWPDSAVSETTYTYIDSSRAAWTNPLGGSTVYYRLRRTSSAPWGWDGHPYAASAFFDATASLPYFQYDSTTFFRTDDDFDANHQVHITLSMFNSNYNTSPRATSSYWDDGAKLYILKIMHETGDTIRIQVPADSIRAALDRIRCAPDFDTYYHQFPTLTITDEVTSPCIHYSYAFLFDTVGATLPLHYLYNGSLGPWEITHAVGDEPYFTNAANLTTLTASREESPEYVRITWGVTDGGVGEFIVEARPESDTNAAWTELGRTRNSFWIDRDADPLISPLWQYRVTMVYSCEGNTISSSRVTTGSRSPYGRIAGRVHYAGGTGCPGITVTATRTSDGATVQTVVTDSTGAYLFDSLPYAGSMEYSITPTSQTAEFHYQGTSSPSATVNLSLQRCLTQGIDFENISAVRLTGRVLFENSSVPVRDANLRLNGTLMRYSGGLVRTDASGNFDIQVPSGSPFTLQVVKDGHTFVGDGYVRIADTNLLTLSAPLDGVRLWDRTKVRVAGRVAGGLDQANQPLGLGLSRNNLGDNLRLVLELEGDNISHVVRIPSDLTKDTLEFSVPHQAVYSSASNPLLRTDTVGTTLVHYQQKRIVIEPDPLTGEFCADLFPVRWKITQATATGYATLFPPDRTSQVLDLSDAATRQDTVFQGVHTPDGFIGRYATSNAQYKLTYRAPISITCRQLRFGVELDYFGETSIARQTITNETVHVPVATPLPDGSCHYLFGAPVFQSGNYSFRAYAHEDYYYNNDPNATPDQVRIKGGTLKIYNGMHENSHRNTDIVVMQLDTLGSADFTLPIDYLSFVRSDTNSQRIIDLSVESDGEYVQLQAVRGYVTGHRTTASNAVSSTHGNIQLLDVLRDPPGSTSSAYIESGTEYSYSYTYTFNFKFGLEFGLTLGTQAQTFMGAWTGLGAGVFAGQNMDFSSTYTFTLPIKSSYNYKHVGKYTFRTNERISTSSSPYMVGQDADVYIGAVQNVYFRRSDAVQPLDSLTYAALGGHNDNGSLQTVGEGIDTAGKRYYLVVGSELETGPYLAATFAYTHTYIRDNLIPQLLQQRDALLLTCDSATAQSVANARGTQVYWSPVAPEDQDWAVNYLPMKPEGSDAYFVDQVASLNHTIADWYKILLQNEAEKVAAIHQHQHDSIATYSIGSGATVSRSESYTYSDAFHIYCDYPGATLGSSNLASLVGAFGKSIGNLITKAFNSVQDGTANPLYVALNAPGSATKFSLKPIIDVNFGRDPEESTSHSRTIGYTLAPDLYGNMDLSIYRLKKSASEFAFNQNSEATRDFVSEGNDYDGDDYLYGSLVYYLRGGASRCPCEVADSTEFYRPKMPISAGTLRLENPKVDIDVHERSNVPADRPAVFTLRLYNETEATAGLGVDAPISFKLKLNEPSNPHGARIYIDGMPLTDGRTFNIQGNQVITKTMEVYAGEGYDFEDLVIELSSSCISTNKGRAQFSVHFMPVACDVSLDLPHDNWVLNTLSPQDSTGYYLPVSIKDFDVNYRGFDHIELQYKLSSHSIDQWVTLCSFYADSARYAAASGNKAMITGGRIDNVHFYGERDPIEQHYDLRAVSFCRHGSGFITKASPVLTGIKDTRPPRVFGQPEPAYGILGVADNIKLRFNEPIAGNYLDEDNNFQILGVTTHTGIVSSTSLHFDGTPSCGASSAVTRLLADKSFTIDLMAKPQSPTIDSEQELFGHTSPTGGISFGLTPDGTACRMYLYAGEHYYYSLPMEPLTDFRRMVAVVDLDQQRVRFFAGTEELTDTTSGNPEADLANLSSQSAPLVFGHGFNGNMLEARVWIKALSQAEIAETHQRRLTGYERKLAAYYPLNEGRGSICRDRASGSTLTLHGFSWDTPEGYALHLDGSTPVTLDQNILSRSNIQDYTLMFWFRTTESNAPLFSAGWTPRGYMGTAGWDGCLVAIENNRLTFRNGNMTQQASGSFNDGAWHHYVLTVNRTLNNGAIFVDGNLTNTFATDSLGGLSGVMLLGGAHGRTPLRGTLDEVALFEQALPQSLVEAFDNLAPYGDEMGLVAFLPFSEQQENSNGILEERFSVNNRRIFKASDGTVVEKIQRLILSPSQDTLAALFATDSDIPPIRQRGLLSKMRFDWSYNQDQLLINLNMPDREINKNNIFITVRNVEDLNGNRTISPTMWQVYVNKNVLTWNTDRLEGVLYENEDDNYVLSADINNISGQRHQYTIDGLPDWLHASQSYGSINPQEVVPVRLTLAPSLPVGIYSEIIYLTDENGLSEPLKIMVEVKSLCPWTDDNPQRYDRQMTLRGQVIVDGVYDSDPRDMVAAIIGGEVAGLANVDFNADANTSYLYLTIHGNEALDGETIGFRLWQAATGRIYPLSPSVGNVVFHTDTTLGLPPSAPVTLSTTANEVQHLSLGEGWNWISFNIIPERDGDVNSLFFSSVPWNRDDQLKSVATRQFVEWDGDQWVGSLNNVNHKHMYMMRTAVAHSFTQVAGRKLSTDLDRTITLHHGWNPFPCLLTSTESLTDALADYIDHARVGDIIKSQNLFAVFSENERWEGSLQTLTPGVGYLFFRTDSTEVDFTFHPTNSAFAAHSTLPTTNGTGMRPATNMTVVASLSEESRDFCGETLSAYVGGQLVGTAQATVAGNDTLFFFTLGTDLAGDVTFSAGNQRLYSSLPLQSRADSHSGSLAQPLILSTKPAPEALFAAYPTLFTHHVDFSLAGTTPTIITIRNIDGVTVAQFQANSTSRWTPPTNLPAGVYFATAVVDGTLQTIKLIKK